MDGGQPGLRRHRRLWLAGSQLPGGADEPARVSGGAVKVHEIVGVMPKGFRFPYYGEIWTPLQLDADATRGRAASSRLAAAVPLVRAMQALLHDVQALDPGVFLLVVVVLLGVGLVASYGPACRAASADPIVVLRGE